MPKREAHTERKRAAAALPNPLTREQIMDARARADMAAMDRANARPIDLRLLEAERWTGGEFSINGQIVRARR